MITVSLNREELRPEIIGKALCMFLTNGIDSVRMDDIASELSISKRTLYEMFSSKENLMLECFEMHTALMRERVGREISEGSDVLSVTLKYLELMIAESNKAGFVFFSNLDKYPKFKKKMESQTEAIHENFRKFLEHGIEQDVFRSDVCLEVLLQAFSSMARLISSEHTKGNVSFESLVNSTVIVLFRGIATKKGMEKLDEYRFKFNNKQ